MSFLIVSMSVLICAIDSVGTNCTAANFFLPIIARTPAMTKRTTVTMRVDSQAGTPRRTRPRTMVTKRKPRPKMHGRELLLAHHRQDARDDEEDDGDDEGGQPGRNAEAHQTEDDGDEEER